MQRVKYCRLWKNHPATPGQCGFSIEIEGKCGKLTEADLLIQMRHTAREGGNVFELPEVRRVGIGQHGALVAAVREAGFVIENELESSADGGLLSCYWLRYDSETDGQPSQSMLRRFPSPSRESSSAAHASASKKPGHPSRRALPSA